jgi:hypothetical protein
MVNTPLGEVLMIQLKAYFFWIWGELKIARGKKFAERFPKFI